MSSRRGPDSETVVCHMMHEYGLLEAAATLSLIEVPATADAQIHGQIGVPSISITRVLECKRSDEMYSRFSEMARCPDHPYWSESVDQCLRHRRRLWIPTVAEIRDGILQEAHRSRYTVHPGKTKMYYDMRRLFWWPGIKADVGAYVRGCEVCQQVKAEHRRPGGLLQPMPIPQWKWEHITMDFVCGLPQILRKHDAIWVIMDRLTKSAHFLPISMKYNFTQLSILFEREIVRLHGVPISIVSDRDSRLTSSLW
ncbi:hypothetical protein Scep_022168 [Stephania cephalantha]|uniref:Integrase catalytic domain-containing protein n=1 Tax=Stephania cephalantha TaxID=152367 RepID=A0AAP0FGG8_9MAGN